MKRSDVERQIGLILTLGVKGLPTHKQLKYADSSLANIILCEIEEMVALRYTSDDEKHRYGLNRGEEFARCIEELNNVYYKDGTNEEENK